MGRGFKLRLSIETGERQRRRCDVIERSRAYLSRGESHARSGSRSPAGDGESSPRLGQPANGAIEIATRNNVTAGASELVVHGRTKEDGYKAERINWQAIGEIRQRLTIPVVANGEIWDWQSAQECMAATGCDSVMIGRGALNVPNLSRVIKYNEPRMPWPQVVELLQKIYSAGKAGGYRFISRGAH